MARILAGICAICCFQQAASAQLRLPRLVSDSMLLQRGKDVRVWGWGEPGMDVAVRFRGQDLRGKVGVDGRWALTLASMDAGGPFDMEIASGADRRLLKGVMVGEVWVCGGQSNMELPMERVKEKYPGVIAGSGNVNIRQFGVPLRWGFNGPIDTLAGGRWQSAGPSSVLGFTAAGYFFARDLYERYKVPIGLIKTPAGGSPAEAWLSSEALRRYPVYAAVADRYAGRGYEDSIRRREDAVSAEWYGRLWASDAGLHGPRPWYDTGYDPGSDRGPDVGSVAGSDATGWMDTEVPGYWADGPLGQTNGVVWYRKAFEVPSSMVGKPVKLMLGRIVDRDSVYVNGIFSGTIGYQYPPRRYELRPGVLHAGKNVIVVRVINSAGRGGFVRDKPYYLECGDERIALTGKWQYRLGARMETLPGTTFFQYQPGALYNGMLAAILPYTVKGVIWYQGEANAGRWKEYEQLFGDMIRDWRKGFRDPAMPFLYVQLANFMEAKDRPGESDWAALREAQRRVLSIPNTGMAVAIDIGEWNDIHPLDKEDVGKRLALAARGIAYGEKGFEYSGPVYSGMVREGGTIRLRFGHGDGLVAKGGGGLKGFAIAGFDGRYVWGDATIHGNEVWVSSAAVPEPVSVRYAWADNPVGANLYNEAGLPASPFRTDVDPAVTRAGSEADHLRMMRLLHIDSLRAGPSGNPKDANAANSDEALATPYRGLPDPLVLNNGKRVRTAREWREKRRPEIVEFFDREIYGRVPVDVPGVKWEVVERSNEVVGGVAVVTKKLLGHVDNSAYPLVSVNIELELTTPAGARGPVPVMMEFGWRWPVGMRRLSVDTSVVPWQEQVVKKGWGYAVLYPTSVQPDNGAGLKEGIIGLTGRGQDRKPDDWGALRAWAWGASRALDYFETDIAVDAKQVGIEGLSRYGKAAAVTMAYDPRFAIGFVGSSGEGGVKIHRRHFGEQVENVASASEYHWMAGNFLKYAGPLTAMDMPVDAHELVALCAPRPVYISSGSPLVEGTWVDAKGMFLGGVGAGPVYELLGKRGLGSTAFPAIGEELTGGEIAWRAACGRAYDGAELGEFSPVGGKMVKS